MGVGEHDPTLSGGVYGGRGISGFSRMLNSESFIMVVKSCCLS